MYLRSKSDKAFLAVIAITSTFVLIGQCYFSIRNSHASLLEAIIRYLSYFTIESNILIAVASSVILLMPASTLGKFFSKSSTLSAIAVYIFIVALVYNLVLRGTWTPKGMERVNDELLHVVVPVLYLIYWLLFVPKSRLTWNIAWWLIYPVVYAIYTFVRGAFLNYYPYPFMDVNKLGAQRVILNTCGLVVAFLLFSWLFVAIGKLLSLRRI
jgi:hypothetical protein